MTMRGVKRRCGTRRGFIKRVTTVLHCLHIVVVALEKSGTPQLQQTVSQS